MSDRYEFPPIPPLPPTQPPVEGAFPPAPMDEARPSVFLARKNGFACDEDPLTAKCWSVWAAFGFTALTAVLTLGGSVFTALLARLPLVESLGPNLRAVLAGTILIGAYALLVGALWLSARASDLPLTAAVGMRPVRVLPTLGAAVAVGFGARMLVGLYALIMQAIGVKLPGQGMDPTRILPSTAVGVVLTVVLACVAAPIAEEMVFRGVLLPALTSRWGVAVGVGGSSAVFALMHVLPFAIPPIFILALILGRIFISSRSLWVTIASHAMFNFIGIVAVYALKWAGVV